MNKSMLSLAICAGLMMPVTVLAASVAQVTNNADAGEGSLRAALESGASKIVIKPSVGEIVLSSSLEYAGEQPLTIKGSGQVISGSLDESLLWISAGADLTASDLTFAGPGIYSIENQGGGKGIYLQVPNTRTGMVSLKLTNVTVTGTGNHGVHVSDCDLGDDCGAGSGGAGEGSDASIYVQLNNVTIDGVGFGKQDADGLRVDDRGLGDIVLNATDSAFINVGADGIELDEGNDGSVIIHVRNSLFENNGAYCSDEFVADPIALDPNCNDDGDPDVDDAFDIDEAGPGGITGIVNNVVVVNNYDEGLDFDSEGDEGENLVDLDLMDIYAEGNADEAIKVSEEGNASVYVRMRDIQCEGKCDIEVEEEDQGNLDVTLNDSFIGDDLKLSEKGEGTGVVKLRDTTVVDEKDFNNIDEI
ncbi:hypothetical protein [Neptuniibacter sp. CAU 1671]|uniref:hypothetical protein n=1 Tax=Neptuniibacter sp. CAU 1671 TaxID=3032593 RepID=UPI0023DC29D6|nr:hypothetical protein [Neptuniibacter sp. CAU 1671]MDF2180674.1 hypothetical protein [Neptuniibacter sp. CAU 1671]